MSVHQRNQRRRAGARTKSTAESGAIVTQLPQTVQTLGVEPVTTAATSAARRQRTLRSRVPEPVDYTRDYVLARRDMLRIAIISVLLFAAMVALKFSGLV